MTEQSSTAPQEAAEQEVAACERTFRRYGLPLLIEDHSTRRDVFGRAAAAGAAARGRHPR